MKKLLDDFAESIGASSILLLSSDRVEQAATSAPFSMEIEQALLTLTDQIPLYKFSTIVQVGSGLKLTISMPIPGMAPSRFPRQ